MAKAVTQRVKINCYTLYLYMSGTLLCRQTLESLMHGQKYLNNQQPLASWAPHVKLSVQLDIYTACPLSIHGKHTKGVRPEQTSMGCVPSSVLCRSRYAAEDLAERYPERPRTKDDDPPLFRSACHIMRKLAALHRRHATRQRGRDRFIPLWDD